MRVWLYGLWKRRGLMSDLRERMYSHYSVIYPLREETVRKKVMNCVFISAAVFILGGGFLLSFGGRDVSYLMFCLFILILLQRFVIYGIFSRDEEKLKEELLEYLSHLTGSYASDKSLEEAVIKAVNEKHTKMATHGNMLNELMDKNALSGEREEYLSRYVKSIATTHLAQLYMVCEMTDKYGDTSMGSFSGFVTNINYIKENVRGELLMMKKRKNEFAMLGFISFLPFFLMRPMEMWARSVSDSLIPYYDGRIGIMGSAIVFVFTAVCFYLVQSFEYPSEFNVSKRAGERHLPKWLEILDEKFSRFMQRIIYGNYERSLKKARFIEEGTGKSLMEYYKSRLFSAVTGAFFAGIILSQASSGIWKGTLIILAAGATFSFLPYASAIIKHNNFTERKKTEVLMLQTVILILTQIKQMSVEVLLKNMEDFSFCYKTMIEKASDLYMECGAKGLTDVALDKSERELSHIFEGIISCDKVSVDKAFSDLKEERAYYAATLIEEKSHIMRNEAALSKMLSFLPFSVVVIIKLVVPFVMDGLSKIGTF
ncbi:MAG: hypothetical protein K6G40_07870 [Eubacterium sp.]|nr:hypothetical protein [Eubacterium sp.]